MLVQETLAVTRSATVGATRTLAPAEPGVRTTAKARRDGNSTKVGRRRKRGPTESGELPRAPTLLSTAQRFAPRPQERALEPSALSETGWPQPGDQCAADGPGVVSVEKRRSRRLLLTTKTELDAMAAPAISGLSSPSAAKGIAATL
jgi:hypothetical protein